MVAGIEMLREIYRQPAFRDLWERRCCRARLPRASAALLDFARTRGRHRVPLRRHLPHGERCAPVVDAELRVRGVERLRVIDASVMPTMTSANTNAASLMIGERGAAMVLEAAARPPSGSVAAMPEAMERAK